MKKLLSIMLLLATMLTFAACGGDKEDDTILNNEPETPTNPFVGTWYYSYYEYGSRDEGYFEIHADGTIKHDLFWYQNGTTLTNANSHTFEYSLGKNDYDEDIFYYNIGNTRIEGRLFREKLIVEEIFDYGTPEAYRHIWTEMTRYDPNK